MIALPDNLHWAIAYIQLWDFNIAVASVTPLLAKIFALWLFAAGKRCTPLQLC